VRLATSEITETSSIVVGGKIRTTRLVKRKTAGEGIRYHVEELAGDAARQIGRIVEK
jgi:hypothetical protein